MVIPLLDGATTLDIDEQPNDENMRHPRKLDRKPDISLIDLPHSEVVLAEYLWRQCAVFMEMKQNIWDSPPQ